MPPKLGWNDRVLPVFLELGKYNGQLYALPKTYETLGLFYNKTLFETNGWTAPTTIAELETLADAMLAKGIVPFGAGNADWRPTNEHYVSIVLNSVAGPENVYKALTGEIPWTAEPFVKAIDTLNSWWQKGYFGPNYFSLTGEQAFAQVATGQAGMSPTGTWNFQNVPRYFPQNNAEPGFVGFPSDPKRRAAGLCAGHRLDLLDRRDIAEPRRRRGGHRLRVLGQVLRRHEHRLAGRVERAAARSLHRQASATMCCRSTPRR